MNIDSPVIFAAIHANARNSYAAAELCYRAMTIIVSPHLPFDQGRRRRRRRVSFPSRHQGIAAASTKECSNSEIPESRTAQCELPLLALFLLFSREARG